MTSLLCNATLFGDPQRPSGVNMCLGDLSQTVIDAFKYHFAVSPPFIYLYETKDIDLKEIQQTQGPYCCPVL